MTLRLFVGPLDALPAPGPGRGAAPGAAAPCRPEVLAPLGAGAVFALPPDAVRHAQVRRVQPGDTLALFDGHGHDWPATVRAMGRGRVEVVLGVPRAVATELPQPVTLAVGMPANERMDWLVEKATELGVAVLQPLLCARAVLRLQDERAERRRGHWQAVAAAAAEQCGRAVVPAVMPVRRIEDWLADPGLPPHAARWLLSAPARPGEAQAEGGGDGQARPPAAGAAPLCALSGPEGGLDPQEQQRARAAGFVPVSLGPRVLRAETAPLALLAWVGGWLAAQNPATSPAAAPAGPARASGPP